MSNSKYANLINDFVQYTVDSGMINNISICAIGKEVIFEYLGDMEKTISAAHNIDVWIVEKEIYMNNHFQDYKVLENKKQHNFEHVIVRKLHQLHGKLHEAK